MKVQYKDNHGNWHLGDNRAISEVEIEVDYANTEVIWDSDKKVIKFREMCDER